jgi:LysR family transcriptional regulator, transcriptional activator for dmlA
VLVAAPAYLKAQGLPRMPQDLRHHHCLVVRENGSPQERRFDHWRLHPTGGAEPLHVQVSGPLSSNSGELVRDWCLAGHGIMLRSLWDIAPQLSSGELVRVLPGWSMPDADIHWLAPYRAQVPRRIRLLVDHLATAFKAEPWKLRPASAPARPGSRRKR